MNLSDFIPGVAAAKTVAGGAALAVLAFGAWQAYAWAFDRGVASQTAIVQQAQDTATQAQAANITNQTAIADLRGKNDACVASVAAGEAQARAAAARIADMQAQLTQLAQDRKHALDKIYATDKTAAAWRDEPVPPALIPSLDE